MMIWNTYMRQVYFDIERLKNVQVAHLLGYAHAKKVVNWETSNYPGSVSQLRSLDGNRDLSVQIGSGIDKKPSVREVVL